MSAGTTNVLADIDSILQAGLRDNAELLLKLGAPRSDDRTWDDGLVGVTGRNATLGTFYSLSYEFLEKLGLPEGWESVLVEVGCLSDRARSGRPIVRQLKANGTIKMGSVVHTDKLHALVRGEAQSAPQSTTHNHAPKSAPTAAQRSAASTESDLILPSDPNISGLSEKSLIIIQRDRIKTLEKLLAEEGKRGAVDEAVAGLFNNLAACSPQPKPNRFKVPDRAGKSLAGIATLFLSDWHFDEYVDSQQVEGMNAFGRDIAMRRATNLFETTGDLLFNHLSGAYYDGLVVALGGDMLSGNIHEELRRTNEAPILESIIELSQVLADGITLLSKEFAQVYVPCVVGNHGRYDKKPMAKGRVRENYDWMVYKMVEKQLHLSGVHNVTLDVPETTDVQFRLYDTTYRLTHGDQFRGGSGIGGKWPTLMRGDARKRKRADNVRNGYNYLMMGHWHSWGIVNNLIVNGSLKGYDEYAYTSNFDYEPPIQGLWVTHPTYGLTYQMPVYCDPEWMKSSLILPSQYHMENAA